MSRLFTLTAATFAPGTPQTVAMMKIDPASLATGYRM